MSHAQAVDHLNRLENAPYSPLPKFFSLFHILLLLLFPSISCNFICSLWSYRLKPTGSCCPYYFFVLTFPSAPHGVDDGCFIGFQHLETDINAFNTVIYYRRYRLTNRAAYIDPEADLSL